MQRPAVGTHWVRLDNLRAFVSFVADQSGYELSSDEMQAISLGVQLTDAEADQWYEYPLPGKVPFRLWLATDPGSSVLWWRAECPTTVLSAVQLAAELMQEYFLVGGRNGQSSR